MDSTQFNATLAELVKNKILPVDDNVPAAKDELIVPGIYPFNTTLFDEKNFDIVSSAEFDTIVKEHGLSLSHQVKEGIVQTEHYVSYGINSVSPTETLAFKATSGTGKGIVLFVHSRLVEKYSQLLN